MSADTPFQKPIWQKTFAALKHRNYRLWFWGQMTSLFGTWMQMTAQGFLVFELTHSSAFLGYVGFASGIPSLLLTMYGGVVADRMSRRKLLIITQFVMMVLALILAILTFLGVVQPWHILLLAFGLGLANAFDAPTRLAFISEMVDRKDLSNAIALNATIFNSAVVVGPAVAGIIYAAFGPGWCFTINGISFVAVIAALMAMDIKSDIQTTKRSSTLSALKEGISYVLQQPIILTLTVLIASVCLFGMSLGTLMPAWSVNILNGNAATNGMLYCFTRTSFGSRKNHLSWFVVPSRIHFNLRSCLYTARLFAVYGIYWICRYFCLKSFQCYDSISHTRRPSRPRNGGVQHCFYGINAAWCSFSWNHCGTCRGSRSGSYKRRRGFPYCLPCMVFYTKVTDFRIIKLLKKCKAFPPALLSNSFPYVVYCVPVIRTSQRLKSGQ